jgi:hypothetical protein
LVILLFTIDPLFFPDELHSLFSRKSAPKVKIEDDGIDLAKIQKMAEEEVIICLWLGKRKGI